MYGGEGRQLFALPRLSHGQRPALTMTHYAPCEQPPVHSIVDSADPYVRAWTAPTDGEPGPYWDRQPSSDSFSNQVADNVQS
jgi:hypothetical protein